MGGASTFKVKTENITVKEAHTICGTIMKNCSGEKHTADINLIIKDKIFLKKCANFDKKQFNIEIKTDKKQELFKFLKDNTHAIKYLSITKNTNLNKEDLWYSCFWGGNSDNIQITFHRNSKDIEHTKKILKFVFRILSEKEGILKKENMDNIIETFFNKNSGNVEINNKMWEFISGDTKIKCLGGSTTKQKFTIPDLSILKEDLDLELFLRIEDELSKIINKENKDYSIFLSLPFKETVKLIELNLGKFKIEYEFRNLVGNEVKEIIESLKDERKTAVCIRWGHGDINWINTGTPGYNYLELYVNPDLEQREGDIEIFIDINYKLPYKEIAEKISKLIDLELEYKCQT